MMSPGCAKGRRLPISGQAGFTLREVVLGIVALIFIWTATVPVYKSFGNKAKMVEGELALHKIQELQEDHFLITGTYSDDLAALGFITSGTLKYYTIQIQLGTGGGTREGDGEGAEANSFQYQARATATSATLTDWVLTVHNDGKTEIRKASLP